MLQKYAVRCGGAHNHIFNLSNCVLVKDNHIKIAGGIRNAVETLRAHAQHTFKFEVECETLDMVQEALDCGVEVIMFDNMDLDEIKAGLKLVNGRAITEASGGINERTIVPIAETGVDVISVGDLTHSVTSVDISLDVQDIKPSAIRTIERLRAADGLDRDSPRLHLTALAQALQLASAQSRFASSPRRPARPGWYRVA